MMAGDGLCSRATKTTPVRISSHRTCTGWVGDGMMEYIGFLQRSSQTARDIGRVWCFSCLMKHVWKMSMRSNVASWSFFLFQQWMRQTRCQRPYFHVFSHEPPNHMHLTKLQTNRSGCTCATIQQMVRIKPHLTAKPRWQAPSAFCTIWFLSTQPLWISHYTHPISSYQKHTIEYRYFMPIKTIENVYT